MISVSVKGERIVDHYAEMNSELHSSRWTGMDKGAGGGGAAAGPHSSAIEEYDPTEEDYDEEEEEYDEQEEFAHKGNEGHHDESNFPSGHSSTTAAPTTATATAISSPTEATGKGNFLRFIKKLGNMTRETGMDAKLFCEAEGIPPPRNIKWYKNDVQEGLKGDRFRIKHARKKTAEGKKSPIRVVSSILKIKRLEVLDKAFYTCEVVSGDGKVKIKSSAILNVLHETVAGVIPEFPSAFDPSFEAFPAIGEVDASIHRIDSFQRGIVPLDDLLPPKDGQGMCLPYRGSVCRKYLENRTIYVHSEERQVLLEEKLKEAVAFLRSSSVSKSCATYGVPSLCYHTFPLCPSTSIATSPLRICREECQLLEQSYCSVEYALVKNVPIQLPLPLPQCSQLPMLGAKCVRLGVGQQGATLLDEREGCYGGKGIGYRGPARETRSGKRCRVWGESWVRKHEELLGGHNFCRNPGGVESSPWCFTGGDTEAELREPCRVEECGGFLGGSKGAEDKMWMTVGAGGAALLLLLFCMLACFFCKRGRVGLKKKKNGSGGGGCGGGGGGGGGGGSGGIILGSGPTIQQLEMNSLLKKFSQCERSKTLEVEVHNVHLHEEMGVGAFGKVYKGEAILRPGELPIRAVIKTLKCSANAKTRQDFFREMELMKEMKHPNILCLLGVVTSEQPKCMIFELMSQGDLHEFLISHSPRAGLHSDYILEGNEMLFIATQVAAGMEYLSAHHYIHRDIAARNCLVSDGLTVKISDFGLSRELYNSDYFVQSKALLPVRWMSPEALAFGKFSTYSDIWAFAVLLWEIYSYGLQPYFGYTNQEVVEIVRGRRMVLPCPDPCPPKMYSLMIECWGEVPQRRPTFEELHSRLKQWLLPLLGPNSNFSPHIHLPVGGAAAAAAAGGGGGAPFPSAFAPPSCASNNSMSSSSAGTGPLSNNTNSTSVSNQWNQQKMQMQTFSGGSGGGGGGHHCVAYQSTPIVHYSPQYQNASVSSTTATFHPGSGRISHHTHSPNSPSPYRVFMESKSTNI